MKSGDPWYKRYSRDIYEGTRKLSLEERGAYNDILDLIYMHGGPIDDDAKWWGHALQTNPRKWRALRDALVAAGKIAIVDGKVTNKRAETELNERHITVKQRRNSSETSVKHPGNIGENREKRNDFYVRAAVRQNQIQSQRKEETPGDARERDDVKGGKVAKSARAILRAKGELDGSQGIDFTDGKLTVCNGAAAALVEDFPGIDLPSVCAKAGPEIAKFGYPSRADALAVLRKWAQIATESGAVRREGVSVGRPAKKTVMQILAERAAAAGAPI